MFRGEFDLAQQLADGFVASEPPTDDSGQPGSRPLVLRRDLMLTGKFASSRSHLEEVIALYDPSPSVRLSDRVGLHPHVRTVTFGDCAPLPGPSGSSLAQSNAAIAEARRLAHPPSLAGSLANGARLLSLAGDNSALDERAASSLRWRPSEASPSGACGNDLSRLGQRQTWRRDGRNIAFAQRHGGFRATGAEFGCPILSAS